MAASTGYPKLRVDRIIDQFLEELIDALALEDRVGLRNFGVFRTVELEARTGRNPRTGEPVEIPSGRHVRFRASKHMREKLNT